MLDSILRRFHDQQATIAGNAGISWVDGLKSWVVLREELARELLRSPDIVVYDRYNDMRAVAAAKGIRIDRLLEALQQAPLCRNGEGHMASRKDFAQRLQARTDAAVAAFDAVARQRLAQLCAAGGTADLFEGLLLPAMAAVVVELGGSDIHGIDIRQFSPSQIFGIGQKISGPRLQQIEAHVASSGGQSDGSDGALAMTLFAGDPTLGSLGETLVDRIGSHPGERLSDIDWPARFTRTCLPFADRSAAADMEVAGAQIRKGDRIAVYLGSFQPDGPLHFGSGPHTCLGKSLAEQVWTKLRSALKARDERMEIVGVSYREADFAFTMPIRIMSRITT
jgi:cytochrome P450